MMRSAGRYLRPLLLPAALLAPAACRETGASAGTSVVRDSAGVAIVESREAAWRQGEELVLSAEPLLAIGEEGGAPEHEFGDIADATRLSDGRLAVFDRMAGELRVFGADGKLVLRTGGKGSGPGEYQFVMWMHRLPGDSLMLMDVMAQRLTVLARDGTVGRSVNLAQAAPPPREVEGGDRQARVRMLGMGRYDIIGPFADGALLARARGAPAVGGPGGGISRDSATYVRLNPDGTLRDTLGTFVGDEQQVVSSGAGEHVSVMVGPPPFGKTAQLALAGDGFWFGSGDRYELRWLSADGRLTRLLRRPVEPLPVTQADIDALKQRELESAASGTSNAHFDMRRMVEQKWEKAVTPPAMPAHGQLVLDGAERLWVRETQPPSAGTSPSTWTVFDEEGRMLGAVRVPAGLRVVEIGDDWLLGVHRDEYDVQQLRLYALQRAP